MNLRNTVAACLFAAGLVGQAAAQNACAPGTRVAGDALRTLLAGRTVYAALGADRWQEYHAGSGSGNDDLIDYKRRPGHPVDPAEKVGTWRASSAPNAAVTHSFGGSASFTSMVCQVGATYTFQSTEGGDTVSGATLLSGQVKCPRAGSGIADAPMNVRWAVLCASSRH